MLPYGECVAKSRVKLVLTPDDSPVSQIVDQIERAVAYGLCQRGDELPGAATLASELGISRVTVQKAYGLLIERSIAEGRVGEGTFIAHEADTRTTVIRRELSSAITFGRNLYLSKAEIVNAFESEIARHFQRSDGKKPAGREPPAI